MKTLQVRYYFVGMLILSCILKIRISYQQLSLAPVCLHFPDIDCKYDPANSDNICKRFVIRVYFQHKRTISANLVRGWLLVVSDRILGTLQASYTGDEAVRSVQVMVLPDVEEYPEDVAAVCEIVQEILANSTIIQNSNYKILEVECLGFEIVYNVPTDGRGIFKTRLNRGLRRVQEVLGDAKVEFRVTGEYTQANRVDEEEKDMEFDTLLEVRSKFVGSCLT